MASDLLFAVRAREADSGTSAYYGTIEAKSKRKQSARARLCEEISLFSKFRRDQPR
jgi:hypothetical protein